MANRNPSTWDEYERGASPGRSSSFSSSPGVRGEDGDESFFGDTDDNDASRSRGLRRRSSVTNRLTALTEIGGVNSIRSFTKSWQRAAGFAEVIPQRPAFVFAPDQAPIAVPPAATSSTENIEYGRSSVESAQAGPTTSLLRQHLESYGPQGTAAAGAVGGPTGADEVAAGASDDPSPYADPRERERKHVDPELAAAFFGSPGRGSIFAVPPHLATPPLIGSYSSYRTYGTVESAISRESMQHAGALWRQQQEAGANIPDGETQPILVKEVEQDGRIVLTVEGQSTLPQTVFNSINVLIGVGLLSLPMGIRYAGWICGMVVLFLSAAVTAYTAKLLAKCMDLDVSIITFSDLAYVSFGRNARIATSVLFTMELLAANVALIILFADSLDLLFPELLSVTLWKVLCSLFLIPLNFLPLRLLSFTSFIGILSCFCIVAIVVMDGFIKQTAPGSLIEPAKTYLFPANWLTLPLSFGLLMSPWGGHSVFPNIYRDMRHPYKYGQAVRTTFTFTYLLDAVTAVAGILMFGDGVRDEITSNILKTSGYPRALTFLMCVFIAIIPLTKIPLNARPLVTMAEVLSGIHQQAVSDSQSLVGMSAYVRGVLKVTIRVAIIVLFLVISILFPAFDSIMAFMGSALCFSICVILPLAFYLKLFYKDISPREKAFDFFLIAVCSVLSIVGTIWAFLPKSLIGADD